MSGKMIIKFWKVGSGDGITINFKDSGGISRNLFIDGGYLGTYRTTIKQELLKIQAAGQRVDLWIITHTDRDHIGGVEAFLKDPFFLQKEDLVKEYWFNWSSYEFNPLSENISVQQGINLRNYLSGIGKLRLADIIADKNSIEWYGLRLTVLSPNAETLNKSKVAWKEKEAEKLIAADKNDYMESIESLLQQLSKEDDDVWNGGSIALLLEYYGRNVLFLADSFPSVVIETLQKMGYSSINPLVVDYIKLSHHGSKRNHSPELFDMMNCSKFIISANGITHSLPNKWTLAQILGSKSSTGNKIDFLFNDDTPNLKNIFSIDENRESYNFECTYSGLPSLIIELTI